MPAKLSSVSRALACCDQLADSGFLRVPASSRSDAGLRFRDLAGSCNHCHLVVYWGVWKDAVLRREHHALLEALARARQIVELTLLVSASVQIVFTDTHAAVNDVPDELIARADAALRGAIDDGFYVTGMSTLVAMNGSPITVDEVLHTPGSRRLLAFLEAQAAKLFHPEAAKKKAVDYLLSNLREAPMVLSSWPLGLFVHIGPAELRPMLPSMPLLHANSSLGGAMRKPWFI